MLRAATVAMGIVLTAVLSVTAQGQDAYLSPLALATSGDLIFSANHTAQQIGVVNTANGEVVKTIALPGRPTGVAVSADGKTVYVTTGVADGQVQIVNADGGEITGAIAVGHSPTAPVLSPDGATLYVCNRFNNDVSVIDLAQKAEIARIPVSREPVAAVITPAGDKLFVANLLPAGAASEDYVSATVSVIDTATKAVTSEITLPNGSTGLHGIGLSPDGKFAYVTHILARYHLPTTQLERGWMNTNALSVIDTQSAALVNSVLLDDVDLGAANPWGVVCSPDGQWVCVAHAGTDEISVIDRAALHAKIDQAAADGKAKNVPNDLAFLVGMRTRHRLEGKGPRGIVAIGNKVYAAEYFSASLGTVDLAVDKRQAVGSIRLGDEPELSQERSGESFFHDATFCFQQWQSCASCHPGDARVDGLNWDLLNDGMGNPKNGKSLLLSLDTPPAMISGVRDKGETAVRAGIRHILFNQLPDEYAQSVDAYLVTLEPVPSPALVNGELSEAAKRGKAVYEKALCSECHNPPYMTDMRLHNVGTGVGREEAKEFDTPTLIEVWRTAPYLNDGGAITIEDVLTTFNKDDLHGETSNLTEAEIADLAEYVRSL